MNAFTLEDVRAQLLDELESLESYSCDSAADRCAIAARLVKKLEPMFRPVLAEGGIRPDGDRRRIFEVKLRREEGPVRPVFAATATEAVRLASEAMPGYRPISVNDASIVGWCCSCCRVLLDADEDATMTSDDEDICRACLDELRADAEAEVHG